MTSDAPKRVTVQEFTEQVESMLRDFYGIDVAELSPSELQNVINLLRVIKTSRGTKKQ